MKNIIIILIILSQFCLGQSFIETSRFGGRGSEPGKFSFPSAIRISDDGTLYVVDTGNNRIQLFNLQGRLIKTIGGFGFENDQYDKPTDIWVRSIINIYVSDYNNQRLQRYDRNMNFISTLTKNDSDPPEFYFYEVASCAVNSQNDLFLLDRGENKIIKFNRNGDRERIFGTYESGEGELEEPVQLDILGNNRLLISDISRSSVLLFDFFGNFLMEISIPAFNTPAGLAVTNDGKIFIADATARKIFVISADLKNISELRLVLNEELNHPQDVAIWTEAGRKDKISLLYIIDENQIIIGKLLP